MLKEVMNAVQQLGASARHPNGDPSDEEGDDSDVDCPILPPRASSVDRAALFELLARNYMEYQCIPVGLALGHSSVVDKSSALAYAAFVEAGADGMENFMDSVLSVTTDMGVEMGMSSLNVASVGSLLPKWLQASQMMQEDDAGLLLLLEWKLISFSFF